MGENNKKSNERENLLAPIKKKVYFFDKFLILQILFIIF